MPHSIIFADRPIRAAGHQLTAEIIADWGTGEDSFTSPPNTTVSAFGKDGSVKDAVVALKSPKLEGLPGAMARPQFSLTSSAVPHPLSFAGVARRSAFRGAMYAGAVGAGAYGAAAYAAPYGRPACGYYPYPPCY